jgi:hypothetical protein
VQVNSHFSHRLSCIIIIYDHNRSSSSNNNNNSNVESEGNLPARTRTISGKSLVTKVQALLLKADDLAQRMAQHRDRQQMQQQLHNLQDSDSSDDEESLYLRRARMQSMSEESLHLPLQDLLRQKEEIRKKIHSFNHTYLEEVDSLIKTMLQSPPNTTSNSGSSTGSNSYNPFNTNINSVSEMENLPVGHVRVQYKTYAVLCALDTLSNRLWEHPLKREETCIAALAVRAQNLKLLQSIFSSWPGLVVRISLDRTMLLDSPGGLSSSASVISMQSSSSSSASSSAMKVAQSPMRSTRQPPPPPSTPNHAPPSVCPQDYEVLLAR